jgi:ABC-type lipoprotein release transport system permease subunit
MFLKEAKYNSGNFLLSLIGIVTAVACVVLFFMMTKASLNETKRLTRDMGFNLKLIPKQTDMNEFWIKGYSDHYMPQEYIQTLVEAKAFSYAHLTATLHKQIEWNNKEVILSGISPEEVETRGSTKSKMIFAVPKGSVYIGYELSNALHINDGDKIEILGNPFLVKRTLAETGTNDDIRIYFDLSELQNILKLEGKVNEIMALNCLCPTDSDDPLAALRVELEEVLPKAKVIMNRTIAIAREKQRKMVDSYMATLVPITLILCAIWVCVFSMLNVAWRKGEIGLLRALGFSSFYVAKLFLLRCMLLGVVGAVIGFGIATWIALSYGPDIFQVTARAIKPNYELLYYSLLLAPLFAVIASLVPITLALNQDSAKILKDI